MAVILIADDQDVDREHARRCLDGVNGLEVIFAGDGAEALEKIASVSPDLVLTDLRMPKVDGLELVRRARDASPGLPVILMTSHGSESVAADALRAGAASYVPKSELEENLVETVVQILEVVGTRRSRMRVLGCLAGSKTTFHLPNDLNLVGPVTCFLQESLERLDFGSEAIRTQIGMALMEALSNAMIHGNLELGSELRRTDREAWDREIRERAVRDPYRGRRVSCEAEELPGRVIYRVRDEGPGFDPSTLPDPTAPENLMQVSGRGLLLIRTFMDSVEFSDAGNAITMTKQFSEG